MRGLLSIAMTSGAPFDLLKRVSHADDSAADIDLDVLENASAFCRALLMR
jgi:hypothetical protein